MLPKYHFIFGVIFVTILYFLFPGLNLLTLSIIFLSSFLIDVDHMFYYFFKKGDINPIRAHSWYIEGMKRTLALPIKERKKIYSGFYLFHGIEWIIIFFLTGYYINYLFIYVAIGFLFHWMTDVPYEFYQKRAVDKISLIWNYHRWRKLKKDINHSEG